MNVLLYCGVRKLHRADARVTRQFIEACHLSGKDFERLFSNVYGKPIPADILAFIGAAKKVRNKVIHGKPTTDAQKRTAIVRVIQYAERMNDLVQSLAGFRPFTGDLSGFAGAGETLNAKTTMWLMRGFGFSITPNSAAFP